MAKGTVNKVIILGRLGQDPEVRATGSGMQVATLSIATNELGAKDQQTGKHSLVTEWHRCTLFSKLAENAATYLKKGSQVYLEGRLQTRKWQDKNTGQDRFSTDIVCHEMQFIGSNNQGGNNSGQNTNQNQFNQPQNNQNNNHNNQGSQQNNAQPPSSGFDDFDDDIPF